MMDFSSLMTTLLSVIFQLRFIISNTNLLLFNFHGTLAGSATTLNVVPFASKSLVLQKLGVHTLGGSLSVFLGLKNTVTVVLLSLVVIGVVL
jgi:hypothetical protein